MFEQKRLFTLERKSVCRKETKIVNWKGTKHQTIKKLVRRMIELQKISIYKV